MYRGFRPGARPLSDDAKTAKGHKAKNAERERREKLNKEKGFEIGVQVVTLDGLICKIVGFNEHKSPILYNRSFVGRGDSRNTRPYDPSVLELHVPGS
jgi:hypothetical protein